MKFCIYSRKSKATLKGDSIANQIDLAKNYILSKYPDTPAEDIDIYEDDGFSGKNIRRPGFARMMEKIEKGEYDYLIVYRLDRISRSVADFADILRTLDKKGTRFVSLNELFDTSSAFGRAMITMSSVFAQLERETTSERVTDNMLLLSHTGRWLGGRTPPGFRAVRKEASPENGIPKAYSVLEEVPEDMQSVRRAISFYAENGTLRGTIQRLHSEGVALGGRTGLSDFALKNLLTNPVYCTADQEAYDYFYQLGCAMPSEREAFDGRFGCMPYNRHRMKPGANNLRSPSEWVIAIGAHRGVVSGREWVDIQHRLNTNAALHPRIQTARNDYALLTGLLICKRCGSKMYTQPQNSGRGRQRPGGGFTYLCERRKRFGREACDCPTVSGKKLDNVIRSVLAGYCADGSVLALRLSELKKEQEAQRTLNDCAAFQKAVISRMEEKMRTLIERLADPELSGSALGYLKTQITQLADEIDAAKEKLPAQDPSADSSKRTETGYQTLCHLIDHFNENYGNMSIAQQRDLIRRVIDRVEWDGEHADVYPIGTSTFKTTT